MDADSSLLLTPKCKAEAVYHLRFCLDSILTVDEARLLGAHLGFQPSQRWPAQVTTFPALGEVTFLPLQEVHLNCGSAFFPLREKRRAGRSSYAHPWTHVKALDVQRPQSSLSMRRSPCRRFRRLPDRPLGVALVKDGLVRVLGIFCYDHQALMPMQVMGTRRTGGMYQFHTKALWLHGGLELDVAPALTDWLARWRRRKAVSARASRKRPAPRPDVTAAPPDETFWEELLALPSATRARCSSDATWQDDVLEI